MVNALPEERLKTHKGGRLLITRLHTAWPRAGTRTWSHYQFAATQGVEQEGPLKPAPVTYTFITQRY